MTNPLLEPHRLPPFSEIEPAHVEPAIKQLIERNKQRIEELLAATENYTWDNLLQPIEALEDELSQAWSPVSHLNSVCNTDALREAYNACLKIVVGQLVGSPRPWPASEGIQHPHGLGVNAD